VVWVFTGMWLRGYIGPAPLSQLGAALGVVCLAFFVARRTLRFYILFELSLLPTLGIVLLYGYQPEKLRAGAYLLLYTALRSLPLLLLFLSHVPYFSFWPGTPIARGLVAVAMSIAFMVKRPLYGVHL